MSEVILSITILLLLVYIAVSNYISIKEREKLIKLLMARNLEEVTDNETIEKIAPEKTEELPPDIVPIDPDDDISFDKHIEDINSSKG
jgi:hypothetical protein